MKTNIEVIQKVVGEKNIDRFLFVTDKSMTAKETNLESLEGIVGSEKVKLKDFFTVKKV